MSSKCIFCFLLIIVLINFSKSYGQNRYYDIKKLTNGSSKYWNATKGVSWRLSINGNLDEYYFNKFNNREPPDLFDVVIDNHAWAIKGDTLFEMTLPSIIAEYKILRLNNDSMVLRSIYGSNRTDTLLFLNSKDQIKPIRK